jgi:hypothetical protein
LGIRVLRLSVREIFENTDGVMQGIWSCLWFIKSPLPPLFLSLDRKKIPKRGKKPCCPRELA